MSSAVLSNQEILEELRHGNIFIEPFVHTQVGNCSYDVTLGENFYRFTPPETGLYNMYDEELVRDSWKLHKAISLPDNLKTHEYLKKAKYGVDDKLIFLCPRETILAHTNEFIGGAFRLTTMMKARSSMGRNFIEVCKCAGWGDIGYINRWTMEITNNSDCVIPLVVGRRIAQIVFMRSGDTMVRGEKMDYIHQTDAKYSDSLNINYLQEHWSPEDMLPKMWKDREVRLLS